MLAADEDVHHRNEDPADNESHTMAKLSADDVRAIRATCVGQRGEQVALAKRYGVSTAAINAIVKRRSWAHLT